jgi:hypothetical protein
MQIEVMRAEQVRSQNDSLEGPLAQEILRSFCEAQRKALLDGKTCVVLSGPSHQLVKLYLEQQGYEVKVEHETNRPCDYYNNWLISWKESQQDQGTP